MCALVVLRFVIPYQARRLVWAFGDCLRSNLFCVEWDVKPQLCQSTRVTVDRLSGVTSDDDDDDDE